MKRLAAVALVAAALIPSSAVAGTAAGSGTGLGASPLRIELKGRSSTEITVRNPSAQRLVVAVTRAGFARTLRGRPRVEKARGAANWLRARPRRLRLAPHAVATLRLTVTPPAAAAPGDHPALLLLSTRPPARRSVDVLLRVGVVVLVRVPGLLVHRLEPQALSVRRHDGARLFALRLANRGNVAERLGGGTLQLVLVHQGETVATLRARRLELLPHSARIAQFVYRGSLRGLVVARVVFRPATSGRPRSFRVTFR